MGLLDYLIFLLPTAGIMMLGFHSRKYIRGVVDFLSAGRLCGRYLLTIGDIANGISILGVLSFIEQKYKVGFAVGFWGQLLIPVTITMALTGYCVYRFRETKAQSVGQFLEMRYGSRGLRFYTSGVRVLAEMLAHSIMPAVAARFFMYFLGLPEYFPIGGFVLSTYIILMVVCMSLAITLICCGGTLTIVLTDTIQGLFCVPIMLLLALFLFSKFDWGSQILPVISDRIAGESFINAFDVEKARDFNLFSIIVSLGIVILHRATWLGGGASGAARTPHEQKMAALLGQWRGFLGGLLYVVIAISIMTILNHKDFAKDARNIRTEIATRVTNDILTDQTQRQQMIAAFEKIPEQIHVVGRDKPLSNKKNLETVYLKTAEQVLADVPDGRGKIQEFRSLYHQQMMSVVMRHLLGRGMLGLFALLMILAMISTDDSYIFSSTQTIVQDLILPFFKKPPSPHLHIWMLRLSAIGVGAFFLVCSLSFAQMDYIELFRMTVLPIYLGGCGPVLVFGLYSRFGTRQAAWTSMLSGTGLSLLFIFLQRNWANIIYPALERYELVDITGRAFELFSRPLNPYVCWEMTPYKFPINGFESLFMIMMTTLVLYIAVSYLTCKKPFNLDRMLHRGIYNIDGTFKSKTEWSFHHILKMLAGITPTHTFGDKCIAWSFMAYSYLYTFFGTFLAVIIWNLIFPWPKEWWGTYFLVVFIIVPMFMAAITAVWFWLGGIIDMRRLLRDLKNRTTDDLDNGMVLDGVSMADLAMFNKLEKKKREKEE
jgi:Na+/proline symporter